MLNLTTDDAREVPGLDPADLVDAYGQLQALIVRPSWHADAACRGRDDLNWFPRRGEPVAEQRAICEDCPVRGPCADAGMGERHGIWGALSERDRRALRRGQPTARI